jgi:endonuclease/exonuclease/phosphatase (EEP) superfamily protein YafD
MVLTPTIRLVWLLPALLAALLLHASASWAGSEQACSPVVETTGAAPALADELEVLSWNIQKASNSGWAEDLASLGGEVDLAFIQEATLQAGIGDIIPGLHQAFARGYTSTNRETGVLTLSAGEPSVQCRLSSVEPWLGTPKATSVTKYPLQGRDQRLLAINLHAINFEISLDTFQAQLHALRELLSDHDGPVILAGDLNTWSARRQAMVDDFTRAHGLGSITFEPDLRTTAFGYALDHIYVRGLQARDARVIPVSSSDHNPLRVRLAIL